MAFDWPELCFKLDILCQWLFWSSWCAQSRDCGVCLPEWRKLHHRRDVKCSEQCNDHELYLPLRYACNVCHYMLEQLSATMLQDALTKFCTLTTWSHFWHIYFYITSIYFALLQHYTHIYSLDGAFLWDWCGWLWWNILLWRSGLFWCSSPRRGCNVWTLPSGIHWRWTKVFG